MPGENSASNLNKKKVLDGAFEIDELLATYDRKKFLKLKSHPSIIGLIGRSLRLANWFMTMSGGGLKFRKNQALVSYPIDLTTRPWSWLRPGPGFMASVDVRKVARARLKSIH